jgi:DNA-nicking Smr family endonuclease
MQPMINYVTATKVEIDIHNMKRDEAKRFLEQFLSKANGNVKEVTVIHGYSSGTVLQLMVRKGLKHHRIKRRILTMNPGVTVLELN